ncbi:hypothetical protein D4R89_05200 [bacterium]|nr:MAG: hypothetical protein D4R89_05200 [bacterium]
MPNKHVIKNRRSVVFAGIFILFFVSDLFPCTLAVISGKAARNTRSSPWSTRGTKRATKPGAAWVYESLKTAFPDIR